MLHFDPRRNASRGPTTKGKGSTRNASELAGNSKKYYVVVIMPFPGVANLVCGGAEAVSCCKPLFPPYRNSPSCRGHATSMFAPVRELQRGSTFLSLPIALRALDPAALRNASLPMWLVHTAMGGELSQTRKSRPPTSSCTDG